MNLVIIRSMWNSTIRIVAILGIIHLSGYIQPLLKQLFQIANAHFWHVQIGFISVCAHYTGTNRCKANAQPEWFLLVCAVSTVEVNYQFNFSSNSKIADILQDTLVNDGKDASLHETNRTRTRGKYLPVLIEGFQATDRKGREICQKKGRLWKEERSGKLGENRGDSPIFYSSQAKNKNIVMEWKTNEGSLLTGVFDRHGW